MKLDIAWYRLAVSITSSAKCFQESVNDITNTIEHYTMVNWSSEMKKTEATQVFLMAALETKSIDRPVFLNLVTSVSSSFNPLLS